jgi:hypothetical protein
MEMCDAVCFCLHLIQILVSLSLPVITHDCTHRIFEVEVKNNNTIAKAKANTFLVCISCLSLQYEYFNVVEVKNNVPTI